MHTCPMEIPVSLSHTASMICFDDMCTIYEYIIRLPSISKIRVGQTAGASFIGWMA
jgi:hypothetical protein